MKLKKNVAAKIIAICLAATMLMGICSASAVTAPKQNGISVGNPGNNRPSIQPPAVKIPRRKPYMFWLTQTVPSKKIIVSDWLKNPAGANSSMTSASLMVSKT